MKKILFIAPYRKDSAPSQRFRFEQYLPYLEKNGFSCTLSTLITSASEQNAFYGNNVFKKVITGLKMAVRRWTDILNKNNYDIIFIAREAFMTGSTFFERSLKKSRAKIIYDFDDAIWIDVVSQKNKRFQWLKNAGKTKDIISLADVIFAGNQYLADYAAKFNSNVKIIPTTIDTDLYLPNYQLDAEPVVIGWSGSVSTIEHFLSALPALAALKKKYGDRIAFRVIGDSAFTHADLNIQGIAWSGETELTDLYPIDIGIMPLPDNEWTWGKCGLKGLQYMALEIPTIMSPVGVNKEIINDGINGFLASDADEWVRKISLLIENPPLRLKIGREGRQTVIKNFSVKSQRENYLSSFNTLFH